jgi:hypothetical protein
MYYAIGWVQRQVELVNSHIALNVKSLIHLACFAGEDGLGAIALTYNNNDCLVVRGHMLGREYGISARTESANDGLAISSFGANVPMPWLVT